MLWAISAVTTPLALILYLFITDSSDIFLWKHVETTTYARKAFLYLANALLLLFVALAFLLGTHLLMVSALAIIIIFYVILYIIRVLYISTVFWYSQREGKKTFAHAEKPGINRNATVEPVVIGFIITLMLLSAINTTFMTW